MKKEEGVNIFIKHRVWYLLSDVMNTAFIESYSNQKHNKNKIHHLCK